MWGINFRYFNVGTNLDDVIGSRARNNAIRLCAKIQDRNSNLTELFRNIDSGYGT